MRVDMNLGTKCVCVWSGGAGGGRGYEDMLEGCGGLRWRWTGGQNGGWEGELCMKISLGGGI